MCKVSVIIPYYNRGDKIARALDSVVNQAYKDMEVILVNDGSTDGGAEVVESYMRSHPEVKFQHLQQENSGPSKARNAGIKKARGEYVAFLDSDDSWEPEKLKIQAAFMDKNRDMVITGTNYKILTPGGKSIIKYDLEDKFTEAGFYRMLFKFFFCLSTVIVRRESLLREGLLFDENKRHAEDHLLFLQIIRRHRGGRLSLPLACQYKFEYGEDGLSKNLRQLKIQELKNFKRLYEENKSSKKTMGIFLYMLVVGYAYLKHLKRWLVAGYLRKN